MAEGPFAKREILPSVIYVYPCSHFRNEESGVEERCKAQGRSESISVIILLSVLLARLLRPRCFVEGCPPSKKEKKNVAHPAANNSPGIMIRATIHCIALPTSCRGIVSRMFGCHPSARNGSTRFLVPARRFQPSRRGLYTCLPSLAASLLSLSPSRT